MTSITGWTEKLNRYAIPERMHDGIVRYVVRGVGTGGFLKCVFENDLVGAAIRADDENLRLLGEYGKLLVNACPPGCWGSAEIVKRWIERGGIAGNDAHEPLPPHLWTRWSDQEHREIEEVIKSLPKREPLIQPAKLRVQTPSGTKEIG